MYLLRYLSSQCAIAIKKDVAICSSCIHQNMLNTLSVKRKEQLKEIPLLKFNNCCIEKAKFSTLHSQKRFDCCFNFVIIRSLKF